MLPLQRLVLSVYVVNSWLLSLKSASVLFRSVVELMPAYQWCGVVMCPRYEVLAAFLEWACMDRSFRMPEGRFGVDEGEKSVILIA